MILDTEEIRAAVSGKWLLKSAHLPPTIDSLLISTDSRLRLKDHLFIALEGENFDGHNFIAQAAKTGASMICLSKSKLHHADDCDLPLLIVNDTLSAYRKISELNRDKSRAKIIAITGTCGKTATKDFLYKILAESFGEDSVIATQGNTNNQIGVPLNLLRISEKHRFAIIEMGTNHFGEIELLSLCAKPDSAIISSIGRGHLEFLKNIEGVAREKSSVFKGMKAGGTAIIPALCEFRNILEKTAEKSGAKVLSFSTTASKEADISASCLKISADGTEIEIFFKQSGEKRKLFLPIPGVHQVSNAMAAAICALSYGAGIDSVCSALEKLSLNGMRMKKRNILGISIINDAYNSNPESAKAGISWLAESMPKDSSPFVFLGDMLELGEKSQSLHDELLDYAFKKLPAAKIIAVGKQMTISAKKTNRNILSFPHSEDAAKFALSTLREGDIVYLKGSRGTAMEKIEKILEASPSRA